MTGLLAGAAPLALVIMSFVGMFILGAVVGIALERTAGPDPGSDWSQHPDAKDGDQD